ncbi:head-tail connector protein [Streptomyces sp. NPDC003343]
MALLTLDDAKAQLNITSGNDDTEIQAYIEAVTPVIEEYVGPVEAREVVENQNAGGGRRVLVLRTTPVLSLTSVQPLLTGGASYPVDGLVPDLGTGEVFRRDGGVFRGLLQVTYQAGRAGDVPATINLAARILVQHLWRTQRPARSAGLPGGGDDYSVSEPVPGFGYAVPNRVLELLAPYRLPPGVA